MPKKTNGNGDGADRRGRALSTSRLALASSFEISERFGRSIFGRRTSGMAFWMSSRFMSRRPSGSLKSGKWTSGSEMSGMGGASSGNERVRS